MSWLERLKIRQTIETLPTKTTETIFVVSVGSATGHIEEIACTADAANDAGLNSDCCCWPYSTAMNTREIRNFKTRLDRLITKGMDHDAAEQLADQLLNRDRDGDDRRLCLECRNLSRHADSWHCGNWKVAGVAIRSKDAQISLTFIRTLQRCNGWHS